VGRLGVARHADGKFFPIRDPKSKRLFLKEIAIYIVLQTDGQIII
jgi:hypothetical protein